MRGGWHLVSRVDILSAQGTAALPLSPPDQRGKKIMRKASDAICGVGFSKAMDQSWPLCKGTQIVGPGGPSHPPRRGGGGGGGRGRLGPGTRRANGGTTVRGKNSHASHRNAPLWNAPTRGRGASSVMSYYRPEREATTNRE